MREKKHHVWANSHNSQVRCASCIRIIGISARRGNAAEEFRISRECVAAPWVAQSPQPAATKNGGDGFSLPIKTKIWVPGTKFTNASNGFNSIRIYSNIDRAPVSFGWRPLILMQREKNVCGHEKISGMSFPFYRRCVTCFWGRGLEPKYHKFKTSFWLTHEKKMKINWSWDFPSF